MIDSSTKFQYLATISGELTLTIYIVDQIKTFFNISVNLLSIGTGASISWTSPYLSSLQSANSPIGEVITSSAASWIGSNLAIGALVGSYWFGWLSEKIGRSCSLILAAVPQIVSYLNVICH